MTRTDLAPLLRRVKATGTLVLIAGTVALLAHGVTVAPRLFARPSGNHQELRKAPHEPVQSPDSPRKRAVRPRPLIA